nr:immunoglobulin heavy chain junction region [Macaca mulatta]MOW26689.1 immunoglobulin heavy chain junction region [Macaca mulatta]MOW26709.1 immunoglobulin heavy chain junction region [Macaca mulatta]
CAKGGSSSVYWHFEIR